MNADAGPGREMRERYPTLGISLMAGDEGD